MVKTSTVNIGGILFNINDDAYFELENYFSKIKAIYSTSTDSKEILNDIECRMSDLFNSRKSKLQILTIEDVKYAISVLGKPEDFGFNQHSKQNTERKFYHYKSRRLYRNPDNRVIGGVCSGLGAYFDIDPVILRIIFVILFFVGFGPLLYIILWIVIPKAINNAQKNEMYGWV
jgi:phage shock protein PspC (stress-responsive transcriptional regulator)